MPVPEGALDRSMRGLTIGLVQRMHAARHQRSLEALAEREERYAIEISGRGEEFPSWQEVHVKFGIVFVDATGQRDSWLTHPHFNYGAVILRGGPIGLHACVTRWDINERREVTGCMLSIGAMATDVARKFRGELHATFQGYGAPSGQVYGDVTQYDVG